MNNVIEVIDSVASDSSRKHKELVLSQNRSNPSLKKLLQYAYNPFITFGVIQYPEVEPALADAETYSTEEDMYTLLDKLARRELTGNAAQRAIKDFLSDTTHELQQQFELIIDRDISAGVGIKTINKVFGKQFIPVFEVMLADSVDSELDYPLPCWAEEKMDGVRFECIVTKDGAYTFYTRNGNIADFVNIGAQMVQLADGLDLVFSLEITGKNRQGVSGKVNKYLKQTNVKDADLEFTANIFDVFPLADFQTQKHTWKLEDRHEALDELFEGVDLPNVRQVERWFVSTVTEVQELFQKIVKSGGEGLILKRRFSYYEHKRSLNWIKVKEEFSCTLLCIGLQDGSEGTKRDGFVGALVCTSGDKIINVEVGTGLTDETLAEFNKDSPVGELIEVGFNNLSMDEDGNFSLFLPKYYYIRTDKTKADNFMDVIREINTKRDDTTLTKVFIDAARALGVLDD